MSNGWKQIWQDLRNALQSSTKTGAAPEPHAPDNSEAPGQPADALQEAIPPTDLDPLLTTIPAPNLPLIDTIDPTTPVLDSSIGDSTVLPAHATASETPTNELDAPIKGQMEASIDTTGDSASVSDAPTAGEQAAPPTPRWRQILERALVVAVAVILVVRLGWAIGAERLWTEWTAPKPPSPDIIATFDGGRITIADLEAHLTLLVPKEYQETIRSPEGLRLLVDEMVIDELVKRWAAERRFDADETFQHTMEHITEGVNLESFGNQLRERTITVPESEIQAYYDANRAEFADQTLSMAREQIRRLLVSQKEQQYISDYIERLKQNATITRDFALLDVPDPTEAQLQDYYQSNTESYTVTAQFTVDLLQVQFGTDEVLAREPADRALRVLQSGADFSAVPAQVQETQLISDITIPEGTWGAEWDAAVRALQPGETSGVLRTDNSWTIVRLVQAQPMQTLPFTDVRPRVLATVRQQQLDAWMQANTTKTLFMLKSKQYSLGQFYKEYRELPRAVQEQYAGSAGMQRLAEQLIERLLLVEETYDQLLQVQNKEILDQTKLNVLSQMMDQEEVDDKIEITDAEIRQFYDDNPELMALPVRARIRYIRIGAGTTNDERQAAQARIDEAYRKLVPGPLQQGADFATVAKEYSEDPETAAAGGELLDWIGETNNPFESIALHDLHQIVLGLEVNQISSPFPIGDSHYIVQVIERTQEKPLSFDEVQPMIRDELHRQKHNALGQELRDRLIKAANMVIYNQVIDAYAAKLVQSGSNDPNSAGGK